jgi:hypothetical protein
VKTNTAKNQYEKAKKLQKATPIVADTISSALSCPSTSNCNRIFTEFDSNLEKEVFSSKFFSPRFVLRVSVQLGARGWGEGGGGHGEILLAPAAATQNTVMLPIHFHNFTLSTWA